MCNGKAMRTLVFANSDSGNSTFAMLLSARYKLHVLDLNNVVWSRKEFARHDANAADKARLFEELKGFIWGDNSTALTLRLPDI